MNERRIALGVVSEGVAGAPPRPSRPAPPARFGLTDEVSSHAPSNGSRFCACALPVISIEATRTAAYTSNRFFMRISRCERARSSSRCRRPDAGKAVVAALQQRRHGLVALVTGDFPDVLVIAPVAPNRQR